MAATLTETDTFPDTITVPEDGDDRDAGSVQTAFQALANRTRYLFNVVTGLVSSDHTWTGWNRFHGAFTVKSGLGLSGNSPVNEVVYLDDQANLAPRERTVSVPVLDGREIAGEWNPGSGANTGSDAYTSVSADGGVLRWELRIPSGARLTRVRAGCASFGGTMELHVVRKRYVRDAPSGYPVEHLALGPAHVATVAPPGGDELAVSGDLPFTEADTLSIRVVATATGQALRYLDVTFLDPGPRNF